MNSDDVVFSYAIAIVAGGIAAAAIFIAPGCVWAKAGSYAGRLDQCVLNAHTREEADICRCDVAREYNRRCDTDAAEVPVVRVTDGGHE